MGFSHQTVNHSLNFVNPQNGTNTQNVESLWNRLKRQLKRMMGKTYDSLKRHLTEWMWKDNIGACDWNNIINILRRFHFYFEIFFISQ